MSDSIQCEVCRKEGQRPRMRHCPEGWFFGEATNDSEPDASPLVIAVCSPQCAQAFFIPGPGDLNARPFYAPTLEQPEPTEGA